MIDLHAHSVFSDGVLIPTELVRRYESYGYQALAITDHADSSNLDFIIPRIIKVCDDLNKTQSVLAIPGIEITHAPPALIPGLVQEARELGALEHMSTRSDRRRRACCRIPARKIRREEPHV